MKALWGLTMSWTVKVAGRTGGVVLVVVVGANVAWVGVAMFEVWYRR